MVHTFHPAHGRQRQADFWVWGQLCLQREFWGCWAYMEKLVSVSKNKQNNPEQTREQKQIGKERKGLIPSFASTCHCSLLKEVGAGTQGRYWSRGQWEGLLTGLFLIAWSLCLLIPFRPPTQEFHCLLQSGPSHFHLRTTHQPQANLVTVFSQLDFPLPNWL